MTEVQYHGVVFEDLIIRSVTGRSKQEYQSLLEGSYTSPMDIVEGCLSDRNLSIKTSGNGRSVGCGDILRFIERVNNSSFTMVVGSWTQQSPTLKRFYEITEFDVSPDSAPELFGSLTVDIMRPFVEYVKSIPPGPQAQQMNQQLWKQKRQSIRERVDCGIIRIDAKIDSKSQRRVQCSFRMRDLLATSLPCRKYTSQYLDIKLPYDQKSPPRSF